MYLKAYREYQQSNYDKCLELLKTLPNDDVKRLDLEAQAYVMKHEYQMAYDIYMNCKDSLFGDLRKENLQILKTCLHLDQPHIVEEIESINFKEDIGVPSLATTHGKKKKLKKRAKRLPKQYDPSTAPDPERWLPRRDRKNAKQRKRRTRERVKGRVK